MDREVLSLINLPNGKIIVVILSPSDHVREVISSIYLSAETFYTSTKCGNSKDV